MAEKDEDDRGTMAGVAKPTAEQIAAIHAAMMEELGLGRLESLPLENKKGTGDGVDLAALDKNKKANDPRTHEYAIVQDNLASHAAWKTGLNDVPEAYGQLDNMDSGQSHRRRMEAGLQESNGSRGGRATRGGRGNQLPRGGTSHTVSRLGPSTVRRSARGSHTNIDRVLARLRASAPSKVRPESEKHRGPPRQILPKSSKHADDIVSPKPNFVFSDKRFVNEVPFGQVASKKGASVSYRANKETLALPKVFRPNNNNRAFALASPEEFLAPVWTSQSAGDLPSNDKKEEVVSSRSVGQTHELYTTSNVTPGIGAESIPAISEPSALWTDFCQSSGLRIDGALLPDSHETFSVPLEIANEVAGNAITLGSGVFSIMTICQNLENVNVILIKVGGNIFLKETLLETFQYTIKHNIVSFYSGSDGKRINWILTAALPGIAATVAEELERRKPSSPAEALVDTLPISDANKLTYSEEAEPLISFLDDSSTPSTAVSQFTKDLYSLMGDNFVDLAVNAINMELKQKSTTTSASGSPLTDESDTKKQRPRAFQGLASSRYASGMDVGVFLNKSAVFQKLPNTTAAFIKEKISKRVLEDAHDETHRQGVSEAGEEPTRVQYSIETLLSLRHQPNSAEKSVSFNSSFERFPTDESLTFAKFQKDLNFVPKSDNVPTQGINTGHSSQVSQSGALKMPSQEPHRKLQGLATSRYANLKQMAMSSGPAKSKELGQLSVTPSAEISYIKKVDSHVLRPIQGLSTSKYASPATKMLGGKHSNIKKSESNDEKPLQDISKSKDSIKGAVKEFKSTLNSQENRPLGLRSSQGVRNLIVDEPTRPGIAAPENAIKPLLLPSISNLKECKQQEVKEVESRILSKVFKSNEPSLPKSDSRSTLKQRDSFNSHVSNDSGEMARRLASKRPTELVRDNAMTFESSREAYDRFMIRTDANKSSESSAEAFEKTSITKPATSWSNQELPSSTGQASPKHEPSKFVLGADLATPEVAEKEPHTKPLYPRDHSELMHGSVIESVHLSSACRNVAASVKDATPPVMPSRKVAAISAKGLLSSRYANISENTILDVKDLPAVTLNETMKASAKGQVAFDSPIFGSNSTSSGVWKPTASQFIPSFGGGMAVSTSTPLPPVLNTFSPLIQPIMATVFVQDPQWPGNIREVSGLLKMGSISSPPNLGHTTAQRSSIGTTISPTVIRDNTSSLSIAPPEPSMGNITKIKDKQQEVQERLAESLAGRKLSRSLGPDGI